MLLFAERRAASREPDDGLGHHDPGRRNGSQGRIEGDRVVVAQRRALDRHQRVDGEGLGVFSQRGDGVDQPNAVRGLLAQTEDAARAHVQPGLAHGIDGREPLIVRPRCDHARIELPRGVDIVVIRRQPGLLELLGLAAVYHAQRNAHLHAHAAHALDHRLDVFEIGLSAPHVAPCSAHAEARTAIVFCDFRGREHAVDGHHFGCRDARLVARGLGAVAAVFRAPASLYIQKSAHLNA